MEDYGGIGRFSKSEGKYTSEVFYYFHPSGDLIEIGGSYTPTIEIRARERPSTKMMLAMHRGELVD